MTVLVALETIKMNAAQRLCTLKTAQKPIDVNVRFRIFVNIELVIIRDFF